MDRPNPTRLVEVWEDDIVPALSEYITIPNVSPAYDPGWEDAGHMAAAVDLVRDWCAARPIEGLSVRVQELPGLTPLILCDVAASAGYTGEDTVLLYGHVDKQPPMEGWADGLGPWTPVRRGDRLYGRGGGDDGYAAFAALAAIEEVQRRGAAHSRCVVVIEASEESGSPDLPAHIEALGDELGDPSLVVCLDSGCPSYDRLWITTCLRGLVEVKLRVDVLEEGVHSGSAGGIVPSSFRILRLLLDRIEDPATGALLVPELHAEVPADRKAELTAAAEELGDAVAGEWPLVDGLRACHDGDPAAQMLARTWEPSLAYVGADGWPPTAAAGNVLRPSTTFALSFRLPPSTDPEAAVGAVEEALTKDPPYGARVTVERVAVAKGFNAPPFDPWLTAAMEEASQHAWQASARTFGEGGSIPFMAMLGSMFPAAQFLVTGVLGPGSNAHGPNEYLHVPYAAALTGAIADVIGAHAVRGQA
jgi:acetylornithine deacetylase/succinyl-diaminopimelate desuccinylase-like protein